MDSGVTSYLEDLARRFDHIGRTSSDSDARFALETLSVEIFGKAQALRQIFKTPDRRHPQKENS